MGLSQAERILARGAISLPTAVLVTAFMGAAFGAWAAFFEEYIQYELFQKEPDWLAAFENLPWYAGIGMVLGGSVGGPLLRRDVVRHRIADPIADAL